MGLLIAMTDPYTLLFYGWCLGVITMGAFALVLRFVGGRRGR
jgi:tetrahydromethanopterin S-methyltransferase subunit B